MLDDLLDIKPAKEMKPYEREIERIRRDKNLLELENKAMKRKIDRAENILTTLEQYLTDRIEKIENKSERATYELMILLKAIKEEKELMK